jgi:hypothetical protein
MTEDEIRNFVKEGDFITVRSKKRSFWSANMDLLDENRAYRLIGINSMHLSVMSLTIKNNDCVSYIVPIEKIEHVESIKLIKG